MPIMPPGVPSTGEGVIGPFPFTEGAPPPAPFAPPTTSPSPPVSPSAPSAGGAIPATLTQTLPTNVAATAMRVLTSDPTGPVIGEFWYRSDLSQLSIRHDASTTKRVTLT